MEVNSGKFPSLSRTLSENFFSINHTETEKISLFLSIYPKMSKIDYLLAILSLWLLRDKKHLLITSEVANQRTRKALSISGVVYKYTYALLIKREVKMAGYWASSFLFTETIKTQLRTRLISSHLVQTSLVNQEFIVKQKYSLYNM